MWKEDQRLLFCTASSTDADTVPMIGPPVFIKTFCTCEVNVATELFENFP